MGNDGLYLNSTIEGAFKEFKFPHPGINPVIFEVKYPLTMATQKDYMTNNKNPTRNNPSHLYEMNKETSDLILKNNQSVPIKLHNSTDSILQQMQIWLSAYEKANKQNFNSKTSFL